MPTTDEKFLMACQNEPALAFKLLYDSADININITTSFGRTPLHFAVDENHNALVAKLLSMGANPNAQDDYGTTPLHEAVIKNNPVMIHTLLMAGASINLTNWQDKTPVELATSLGNHQLAGLILSYYQQVKKQNEDNAADKIEQLKQVICKQEKFIAEQQEIIKKQQYIIQQQHKTTLNTTTSPKKRLSRLESKALSADSLSSVQKQKTSAKPVFFSDKPAKDPNKIAGPTTDKNRVTSNKRQKLQ